MGTSLEDLRMLQDAERVADEIWQQVTGWKTFARDVVGGQLVRASDSIGANIAEAFGRFHYGEKLQFLYYARGSLFEAKYWLNRTLARDLISSEQVQTYASQLTGLAFQINAFANSLKAQRRDGSKKSNAIRESDVAYVVEDANDISLPIFDEDDLKWLDIIPNNPETFNL